MSQVIIASQLDEDFNAVIRQRLALTHPGARSEEHTSELQSRQ